MAQRKSGHVTLLDISQACGCSVSTVSIVLAEAPLSQKIASETREKVRAMAQRLGYHPDAFARSLRMQRSQTIGVLAYDLSDPYCMPIAAGIQAGLEPAQYLPLLMDARSRRGLFDSYLQMILERRAEGVIIIASWILDETDLLADLEKNHVPIIIVSRDLTGRGVSSILVDNDAGGWLAMRHLLELGHRRIAVIRGPEQLFDSAPRWAGVQRAAAACGVQLDPQLAYQLQGSDDPVSSFEGGQACVERLVKAGRSFSAVLAFDDLAALGAMRGLYEAGLQVPRDCSVVGFDDVLPASVSTPSITTIRQPLNQMGQLAATWMLEGVKTRERGRVSKLRVHKAQPELVVRSSTAKAASRAMRIKPSERS